MDYNQVETKTNETTSSATLVPRLGHLCEIVGELTRRVCQPDFFVSHRCTAAHLERPGAQALAEILNVRVGHDPTRQIPNSALELNDSLILTQLAKQAAFFSETALLLLLL